MLLSGGACPSSVAFCFMPSNVVLVPFSPSPSGWLVASNHCRKRTPPNVCPRGARAYSVAQVLKKLAHFNRPFKYIGEPPFTSTSSLAFAPCPDAFVVTCMVAQNTGSSTHTAHTYVSICASMRDRQSLYPHAARCFWDTETDGIAHAASHCAFREFGCCARLRLQRRLQNLNATRFCKASL